MLKNTGIVLLAAALLLIVSTALEQGPHVPIPADMAPGAERLFPDEAAFAKKTAELMIASIAERHKDAPAMLRAAHPCAHGCRRIVRRAGSIACSGPCMSASPAIG